MPMHRLTIKYVNPPKEGKKRGSIKGTDDSFFLVIPGDLHLFEPGKTYDVVYIQNGEWKTVQSATAVEASPQRPTPTAAPAASHDMGGEFNRQTNPIDAQRMFVCANLTAFIAAGKVELDPKSLGDAVNMLKRLWTYAFEGDSGTFTSGTARMARG